MYLNTPLIRAKLRNMKISESKKFMQKLKKKVEKLKNLLFNEKIIIKNFKRKKPKNKTKQKQTKKQTKQKQEEHNIPFLPHGVF